MLVKHEGWEVWWWQEVQLFQVFPLDLQDSRLSMGADTGWVNHAWIPQMSLTLEVSPENRW